MSLSLKSPSKKVLFTQQRRDHKNDTIKYLYILHDEKPCTRLHGKEVYLIKIRSMEVNVCNNIKMISLLDKKNLVYQTA